MSSNATIQITILSECELQWKRDFKAPIELVFEAYTKPELVRRWLIGAPGSVMTACEIDFRVGGSYHYAWSHPDFGDIGIRGEYVAIQAPRLIVVTERFDQSWYPGVGQGTAEFSEKNGVTTLTNTMRYESKQARDQVLQSNMEWGLSAGYKALDQSLAGTQEVERYLSESRHPLKPLVSEIRRAIHDLSLGLNERVKWNAPSFFQDDVDFVTFNLAKEDRVLVVFHRGSKAVSDSLQTRLIDDSSGKLRWAANDRATLEYKSVEEFQSDAEVFGSIVQTWIKSAQKSST